MTKSRTNADNVTADIAGITAGTGITGGGTSGTVTITNDMATTIAAAGDLIYGTANDAYAALSLGTAGQLLKVNSGATAPEWATVSASPANDSARVETTQSTTSTGYTDLATVGPAVTLTTGTKALVIVSGRINPSPQRTGYIGYAVSGSTTISPTDATALFYERNADGNVSQLRGSSASLVTLTAGSNTFTAKYRHSSTDTANFQYREITVIDMGS